MLHKQVGMCLAVLLLPSFAAAQAVPDEGRERVRTLLVLRMTEALKLTDEQALQVNTVIRESDEHRQRLSKERQTLEDALRAALNKHPSDTAELSKLIGQGNELDQKLALIPEDSFHELQKTLTVEQQAKLLLFRRELETEIRHGLTDRRQGVAERWQLRTSGAGATPGKQ